MAGILGFVRDLVTQFPEFEQEFNTKYEADVAAAESLRGQVRKQAGGELRTKYKSLILAKLTGVQVSESIWKQLIWMRGYDIDRCVLWIDGLRPLTHDLSALITAIFQERADYVDNLQKSGVPRQQS